MYITPRTIANDRLAFQLTIALAVAIAQGSATAADNELNGNSNSVAGESCKCVPFYQCKAGDEVVIPLSSTTAGCLTDMVCCRVNQYDTTSTGGTLTATEPPLNDTLQDPDVNQQQCTCVPKNQCLIVDYSTLPTFNTSSGNCSYGQVCCNVNHTVGGTNEDNNNNNARSCGVGIPSQANDIDQRIVHTDDDISSKTYPGQFPWMVIVTQIYTDASGSKTDDFLYLCGGSLIHPQVILTAAHCVKGRKLDELRVRVGEWDTLSNNNTELSHEDISVSEVVTHPYFNNGSLHNDVALIKLSSGAVLHHHINTICIPNPTLQSNSYDSNSCVVTGWGKKVFAKKGQYQNTLKAINMPIIPNDECQQKLKRTRLGNNFILDKSFVCAGGVNRQDACIGDGGGPLICAVRNGDTSSSLKKYIQVGIVSWGIGCGDENVPGVYSSLEANSEWINQILGTFTR